MFFDICIEASRIKKPPPIRDGGLLYNYSSVAFFKLLSRVGYPLNLCVEKLYCTSAVLP